MSEPAGFKLASDQALFTAYTEYAKMAMQTIFLMNGGGAVALLTFLASPDQPGTTIADPENIKTAINCFVWGIVAGVAATGFAFATEFTRFHNSQLGPAWVYGSLGLVAALLGYGMFAYGCVTAAS